MTDEDHVEQATTFDAEKAPQGNRLDGTESYYEYYKRLSIANSLDYNGKWKDKNRETRKNEASIIDAISGQLELTNYQTNEVHRRYSDLPTSHRQGFETLIVALSVCMIVANEDGRGYHPNHVLDHSNIDNEFTSFVGQSEISHKKLYSCWESTKRVLDR